MSWSLQQEARLRELWDKGWSASDIARDLGRGLSRNAVIGKVQRMGLGGRGAPSRPSVGPSRPGGAQIRAGDTASPKNPLGGRLQMGRAQRHKTHPPRSAAPALKTGPEAAVKAASEAPAAASMNLTLLDLGPGQCRYPTSPDFARDVRFCGHGAKEGSSYCPAHHALCFNAQTTARARQTSKNLASWIDYRDGRRKPRAASAAPSSATGMGAL